MSRIARVRTLWGGAAVSLVLLGLLGLAGTGGAADEELTPAVRKELEQRANEMFLQSMRRHKEGNYKEALKLAEEVLTIRRRLYPKEQYPDGHIDLAGSLNSLGFLLQAQGEYTRAEPYLRGALEMRRKLFPGSRYPDGEPQLALSLNNMGGLFYVQGEYARAEPYLREALEMLQKLCPKSRYPDGHFLLAYNLNNLGGLLKEQGEYARAEPLIREALEMNRKLYPRSRYPFGHPDLATSLNNVGVLLRAKGEFAKAEPFSLAALDMRLALYPKSRFPDGHPDLATSFHNLGVLLDAWREPARAEEFFQSAVEMRRKLYPKSRYPDGHPELVRSLCGLGFSLDRQGKYAKGEAVYQEALEMCRSLYPKSRYPDGHLELASCLDGLGFLLDSQGEHAKAEPFLRDALAISEANLRNFADLKSEAEALNRLARFPITRDGFLSATRHLPPRAEHYEPLWQSKSALTRILERRHLDALASEDEQTRGLALDLRSARERLARLTVVPLPDPKAHAERLKQLTEEKEEAEKKLARRLKLTAPTKDRAVDTADDLLRALPESAAFVDLLRYWSTDQKDPKATGSKDENWTPCYVAFVLRKGQPIQRVELGEAAPIERALKQWRREIIDWRPDRKATPSGADAKLSELVWKPLARYIPADTATVYLSPDADLTALPWAALPGREKGKVLLEEHALALVPHGHWLLERLQARSDDEGERGALLALGAVAYGRAPKGEAKPRPAHLVATARERGGRRAEWADLKATERELEQVIARAGRRKVIVRKGADAGIAQVSRDLEGARFAHLATHGFFDDRGTRSILQLTAEDYRLSRLGERIGAGLRSPLLLSGLVLAGANRREKDRPETWATDGGILLGEEIVGRNLHHMELAVLSACETGLGDVAGGEGVFGLQRAFHVAGCRNVIASLWQVDDDATAALMNLFYARLWHPDPAKRLPPLQALREAQLTLYRQPELIPQFARGEARGPKPGTVIKIEDYTPPKPAEVKPGEKKSHPRQWAAFVLSGDGK